MNQSIRFTEKEQYTIQAENVSLFMLRARTESAAATDPQAQEGELTIQNPNILHTHAHAELFACLRGSVHLQTAGGILVLQPGDVAVVAPGFAHTKLPDAQPTRFCALDFTCTLKKRTTGNNLMKDLGILSQSGLLSICRAHPQLCEELMEIAENEEHDTPYLPALRLLTVLAKICHLPLEQVGRHEPPRSILPTPEPSKDIDRLDRLANLLTGYFMTDLTVEKAAELLFISTRQLERIVQKEYGSSFHRVLCDQRVNAAEQMLADPALSIAYIGATVGFPSRAAFCRAFEARYGKTPAAYRKTCKKLTPSKG